MLLTFLEAGEATSEDTADGEPESSDVVYVLRDKLRQAELRAESMRDDYHLANEDLRAANEELQSLNEEYRSTTEELETSKEELQSINEELQTVNHELKAKVEALSQANSDLENLMAAAELPVLFLDRDLCIKRLTPQVSELFSTTTRDIGRPIGDFTHRLAYDRLFEDARRVLAGEQHIEREVQSNDGQTFLLRVSAYRVSNDSPGGVVLTFVDISKLKRTEEELRRSWEAFRALIDVSAQAIWRTDASGRYIGEPDLRDGRTEPAVELLTTSWLEAVHDADRAHAESAWRAALESGEPMSIEMRVRHPLSEEYRWTTIRAVPLTMPDGNVRGWVGIHLDVDEYRTAEAVLREADHRKDEFLALLGHELRNPLAAIRSSVEIHNATTAADASDAPDGAAWTIIDRQSGHMIRLINDMLDMVRIDRGKLRLERGSVSLSRCIREVVAAMQSRIDASGIELELDLTREPLFVHADAERLVQILGNVLRNAVDYTPAGGKITIQTSLDANQASVLVRDTGIGMQPEQIEALFEPYAQADRGRPGAGLGLGLTLVRHLLELHDGSISATSAGPGSGSNFLITLPLAQAVSIILPPKVAMPRARRILVVDDDADVADMFAQMLKLLGQEVEVAHGARQAIERCEANPPEVVFIDLSMPDIDGSELARRLRARPGFERVYLIALSGFSLSARGDSHLFDRHLLKPAGTSSVVEVLNSLPS
ncbi:MAG: PAS domain-containing protein [Burkholderiaceae bacterium]